MVDKLKFDNRFTRDLPADPDTEVRPRQVHHAAFSRVHPTPTSAPETIAVSREVVELLGLDEGVETTDEFAQIFSGNLVTEGMDPFAMCYGGHQFGHWAGQLGDGRAIALGEVIAADGSHQTLQLKGAGPTPYSRSADGRAVLRSSVREFLCSEAMHHLGVPTTRALSLTLTGDDVVRDMFYSGNPAPEKGAVVCRVAPSFVRLGSFEIFAAREELEELRALVDFTLRSDFPHLGEPSPEAYAAMFSQVVTSTAHLMVDWMRVGFVHGVMNTDNLSILGLTIDYGPYGWLENFDPAWTPNTTDAENRRYRYGQQPQVAHWNLLQLANALLHLVDDSEPFQTALNSYVDTFKDGWRNAMTKKLGLGSYEDAYGELFDQLTDLLQQAETDMTIFYRRLAQVSVDDALEDIPEVLKEAYYVEDQVTDEVVAKTLTWLGSYLGLVRSAGISDEHRRAEMDAVNPKYVLRNYMAQLAIDKADAGDNSLIAELLDLLRQPYAEQPEREQWAAKRPEWARERAGCSMLSCSS